MNTLPWSSILIFCLFAVFISNQQRHHQTFEGSSRGFHTLLGASFAIGTITAIAYLIYLGVTVVWWSPFVAIILGYSAMFVSVFMNHAVEPFIISMVGFIGWPVCAYLMFAKVV